MIPEQIPDVIWRNIDWLHECRDVQKLHPILPDQIIEVRKWLFATIGDGKNIRLQDLAKSCDDTLGYRCGTSLKIIRHLIANKHLDVDITKRLRTDLPIEIGAKRALHV